ncbi:hypothetical protein GCM10007932_03300 [Vibrio penaeicida]|uniref:RDD domain-containing protein n=1 Tax=Vibrio penaeicida TaxID=104609 RepID=A0AAV5NKE1_9VIBR|nr:hypothetical protein GCM10007932_03300 [Vibrio penaeicida]
MAGKTQKKMSNVSFKGAAMQKISKELSLILDFLLSVLILLTVSSPVLKLFCLGYFASCGYQLSKFYMVRNKS